MLEGRTVGLLFRKHSTRTRVSLEVAAAHLGATALYLRGDELQLARGEPVEDGNNVCASLAEACALLGAAFTCASPPGYEPDNRSIALVDEPRAAAEGAHVVATDVWTSMGREDEHDAGLRSFAGFTVDAELLALADPDAIVLHCLPAHPAKAVPALTVR